MTDTNTPPALPANAAEAMARLNTLVADKEWGAKLLRGDVETTKEYSALTEMAANGDKVEAAIAGTLPGIESGVIPDSESRLMADVAADLREHGISDGAIRQALTGQPVSPAEHALVTQWKAEKMSDREWVAKFLSGDALAVKQMKLANISLNGGIEGKEPTGF